MRCHGFIDEMIDLDDAAGLLLQRRPHDRDGVEQDDHVEEECPDVRDEELRDPPCPRLRRTSISTCRLASAQHRLRIARPCCSRLLLQRRLHDGAAQRDLPDGARAGPSS